MSDPGEAPSNDDSLNFSENILPENTDSFFVETFAPARGIAPISTTEIPGTHDQKTRKQLAFFVLTMVGVFYAAILWCFLAGWIDKGGLTTAIAAISGIQALAAAAIGFYYGSKQD